MVPHATRVPVFRTRRRALCRERALVLEAMGIEYEVVESFGRLEIVVRPGDEATARSHLAEYEEQSRNWPPPVQRFEVRSRGLAAAGAYAVLLVAIFLLDRFDVSGLAWYRSGVADATHIRDGEWWRVVTSLCLHVDVGHLFGNLFFGALFGCLAAQLVGSGTAWCAILAAGAGGNALNAWIQHPTHVSLGASTAVFGALGLIVAYPWIRRRELATGLLRRWAPPVIGLALLGYLGTSGARTDVLAHVLGFGVGGALGAALALQHHRHPPRPDAGSGRQVALGLVVLLAVAGAWARALRG